MERNDCDDFPDAAITGSSALYPLAKGAIQMLLLLLLFINILLATKKKNGSKINQSIA